MTNHSTSPKSLGNDSFRTSTAIFILLRVWIVGGTSVFFRDLGGFSVWRHFGTCKGMKRSWVYMSHVRIGGGEVDRDSVGLLSCQVRRSALGLVGRPHKMPLAALIQPL